MTIPLAWAFWIPLILMKRGLLPLNIPDIILSSLGGLSPILTLVIIEKIFYRKAEDPKLVKKIIKTASFKKIDAIWLVLAAVIFPLLSTLGKLIYYSAGIQPELKLVAPGPDELGWALLAIIPIHFAAAQLTSPLFEEPGWRGFALTRLDQRFPWAVSSLIVGCYWFVWHQGMNLAFDLIPTVYSFLAMLAQSFLIDALFRRSGRNLLVAMFGHQSLGIMIIYFPNLAGDYLYVVMLVVVTVIVYLLLGKQVQEEGSPFKSDELEPLE